MSLNISYASQCCPSFVTHIFHTYHVNGGHDHLVEWSSLQVAKWGDLRLPGIPVKLLWLDIIVVHGSARRKLRLETGGER